jgi:tetratricopeptide (TPR) repeat protein
MQPLSNLAQLAIACARRGEFEQALGLARQALAKQPLDHGLMLFVGMLHSRKMELNEAIRHFRKAAEVAPKDPVAKLELARVLIATNQVREAEELLRASRVPGLEPKRLQALILIRKGDHSGAADLYREIIEADPRDFESWGNLGVCRLAAGDAKGALEALTKSLRMRRDQQRFREKWAEAQIAAGEGEEGLELCLAFAAEHPEDPLVRVTIARLQDLLGRPELALESLQAALRLDPAHAPALVALAQLHERQNRIEEFAGAVARLEEFDEPVLQLPLLKAQLAFRKGDLGEALELAAKVRELSDPGGKEELVGKIHDRLGNAAEAFEAFVAMNRDTGVAPDVVAACAEAYRTMVGRRARIATRKWVRSWRKSRPLEDQRDPVFLVGFPRSGTTLLDTLLMGHPQICVTEEKPMLESVGRKLGGYERLAELTEPELNELRELYLAEAATHVPDLDGRMLVDKQPFAMVEAPLIYRLFPNARILHVQRHPCDVVLSCFITRFEPNAALSNFVTLEGTARLYGELRRFWSQCRSILPMIVHLVRYERLVDDAESEMRALLTFLGLPWTDDVLDNRSIGKDRGFINTPSYSQVVEPLYDRSIGRWERYREQMEPVLPILTPWAQRMGYEV